MKVSHGQWKQACLGDSNRPHFHRFGALYNVDRGIADGTRPQVLQQISGLQSPKLRICMWPSHFLGKNYMVRF